MDKATLTNLYDSYKNAWQLQRKAQGYKHDFDMAVQGATSTRTFTKHGDAASLHLMLESMNHFVSKNPVGKAMMQYHAPHFKVLEHVTKAINDNDNEVTRAFENVKKELELFAQNAPNLVKATGFDPKELQQGPISYCMYLTVKEGAVGDAERKQMILGFVALITSRAEAIVYNLDNLLSTHVNLYEKYAKLYRQTTKLLAANEAKGGLTAALAQRSYIELASPNAPGSGLLDKLCTNRNHWADWLGVPTKTRADYDR